MITKLVEINHLGEAEEYTPFKLKTLKALLNKISPKAGSDRETSFFSLRNSIVEFAGLGSTKKSLGQKVTQDDLAEKNFTDERYLEMLKYMSEFVVWAFPGNVVPERIEKLYREVSNDSIKAIMNREWENLSKNDLISNPGYRFPCVILIDNSIKVEPYLEEIWSAFNDRLLEEINGSRQLSSSIELYIMTCGGSSKNPPKEIVGFCTYDRQKIAIHMTDIRPYGQCMMGAAICISLDKLEQHIRAMSYGDVQVDYWKPWLIILTNGDFRDDISEALSRLNRLRDEREISVYPIGISEEANMDNLKKLDKENAMITLPQHYAGFFKDVFNSLKKSQDSIPGSSESLELVHKPSFTKN